MLSDFTSRNISSGALNHELHRPYTFYYEILDFIKNQLPIWRDRISEKNESAENTLTEFLCDHLNSTAHGSNGFDIIQFRTEVHDEKNKSRKIDLAPKPCNSIICIDGNIYKDFNILMPIECKRLPTPKGNKREDSEYVITRKRNRTTGGIQRFKEGHHGAHHNIAGMIAYIQDNTRIYWHNQVNEWITEIINESPNGWTEKDHISISVTDDNNRLSVLHSNHQRVNNPEGIHIQHLWIEMN